MKSIYTAYSLATNIFFAFIFGYLTYLDGVSLSYIFIAALLIYASQTGSFIHNLTLPDGTCHYVLLVLIGTLFPLAFNVTTTVLGEAIGSSVQSVAKTNLINNENIKNNNKILSALNNDLADSFIIPDEELIKNDEINNELNEFGTTTKTVTSEPSGWRKDYWLLITSLGPFILASLLTFIHLRLRDLRATPPIKK